MSPTPIDLARLKASCIAMRDSFESLEAENAFVEAANPATILALIARLEAAEAVVESSRALLNSEYGGAFRRSLEIVLAEDLNRYDRATTEPAPAGDLDYPKENGDD